MTDEQQHVTDADRQDIRLAVVLNGGVSLAVWIGGVAAELNQLVQASRAPDDEHERTAYAGLLQVLNARARVDVIAGTSAGGLNGGFLSLGLVHGCDLDSMRALWADKGDLGVLLRDPRSSDTPSLMSGEYFHEALAGAYRKIAEQQTGWKAPPDESVELYLTGTLWDGRRSPFTDEMDRRIVEVNHDATFQFSSDPEIVDEAPAGDLRDAAGVAPQLAVASRCTSSFPGAFEPWWVDVGAAYGDRWTSTAGLANFADSQYVVDGGVLLNKPIRPALDAVYRQSASWQVRRLMAYVVPDPGEAPDPAEGAASGAQAHGVRPPIPNASQVGLGVLTRLRGTGSVAAELAEIEVRNDEARLRSATRDRLAASLLDVDVDEWARAAYPAYREVRRDDAARIIAGLLARREQEWSKRELAAVIRDLANTGEGLPYVPPEDLGEALGATPDQWRWGQAELDRLGDLVTDVLRRAIWLAPLGSDARTDIVAKRVELHTVLAKIRQDTAALDQYWMDLGRRLPSRGSQTVAPVAASAELRRVLAAEQTGWEGGDPATRRTELHTEALNLAGCLYESADSLRAVSQLGESAVDPGADERSRLAALVRVLLGNATDAADVLRNMLRLQVIFVAFAGATSQVEQEVELVQVSSTSPELLTGLQVHHFGAFYRASWRVNDWMRGRLDGATQLVQMLLTPVRLRQLGMTPAAAYDALREVAVGPPEDPLSAELGAAWDQQEAAIRAELAVLDGTGPPPRVLPLVSARIAERVHAAVLPAELRALAAAVRGERDPLRQSSDWASQAETALRAPVVSLAALRDLRERSSVIGTQRIDKEIGQTDTFARTASHGLASLTSMLTIHRPRLVGSILSALRGYALLVWVLVNGLTERSKLGVNMVTLALGVGGALLGVTVVVPGVPFAIPLVGAGLVLGAASATALTHRMTYGRLGARLIGAVLLVVAALVGYVWWTVKTTNHTELRNTLLEGLARVAVVAVIVGLGWWLAHARPPRRDAPPSPPAGR